MYRVIEEHKTEYPNPILLKIGEKVIIGEESSQKWANWIFCTKLDRSNNGWVPKQIIKYDNSFGLILEDYSAKELDIDKGTLVEGIKELNGWVWSKNVETNEIGWIPLEKLETV